MSEAEHAAEDLRFVKEVVERRGRAARTPLAVPVLWGVIVLVGCIWNDFHPLTSWIFWMVAPPVGFLLSGFIGGRAAFAIGEYTPEEGIRQGLHWACIFFAGLPVLLLAMNGQIHGYQFGQLLILVSGIVYYLAGVHLDRRWMLPGIVMMLGAAALTYRWSYAWTTLGVALFLSLVLGFTLVRPRHV